jgi:hypothetical protein
MADASNLERIIGGERVGTHVHSKAPRNGDRLPA